MPPLSPSAFSPLSSAAFSLFSTASPRQSYPPSTSTSASRKRPTSVELSRKPSSIDSIVKRANRSQALECLEGRSKAPRVIPARSSQRNFMNMSDDEDDADVDIQESTVPPINLAVAEDEDVVLPPSSLKTPLSAPLPQSRSRASSQVSTPSKSSGATGRGRKRRSTMESWFPLVSFMDLKEEDVSGWNWRSFIEVSNLA